MLWGNGSRFGGLWACRAQESWEDCVEELAAPRMSLCAGKGATAMLSVRRFLRLAGVEPNFSKATFKSVFFLGGGQGCKTAHPAMLLPTFWNRQCDDKRP